MTLPPGTRLGPYEVVASIGAGGMGEVYRARDTKLNREVALKVLPEQFASQPERVARFEREAQLLASFNHPHIAQIYGIEHGPAMRAGTPGIRALAMELVPGQTLTDLIAARGSQGLDVNEALGIACQIAEALDAAHEKGIVHRDLKPGNVMVTPDGHAKLLDFGLGKTLVPEAEGSASDSPTITAAATQAGMLLGTAAYMAPEQAKGRPVDKRCDVWAFGCVLYEMLTGRRAFGGDDVTDALAAILRAEPDWNALPAGTPVAVRRLLVRCLEKDRKRRLRDVGDALLELAGGGVGADPVAGPIGRAPSRRHHLAWLAALTLVTAASGATILWQRSGAVPPGVAPETRLEVVAPQTSDSTFAIARDGRAIVFVAPSGGQNMLWLRRLEVTMARPLPGTEGGTSPFWSPDGQSVGFYAQLQLKRIDLATGNVRMLAETGLTGGQGGAWSASNTILYRAATSAFLRISADGGQPSPVAMSVTCDLGGVMQPEWLDDSRRFLFFCLDRNPSVRGIYLGSLDAPGAVRLIETQSRGQFIQPGSLAYIDRGTLFARRLAPDGAALTGDAVRIADSVAENPVFGQAMFSVSASGVIAYRSVSATRRQLTWFDRRGTAVGTLGEADDSVTSPDVSPDGRRAVVQRGAQGNSDIWTVDTQRMTRVTFNPLADLFAVWSPDGQRIAFLSTRDRKVGLWAQPARAAGAEELLTETPAGVSRMNGPTSWSRDGKFILFDANIDGSPGGDIWVLPLTGDRKAYPFLSGRYAERLGQFSPDGRFVAYQSAETGRAEIYVRPFAGSNAQWQVSTAGGAGPRWRNDGRELYWIAPDGKLMAAPIEVTGAALESGSPVALFQTDIYLGGSDQPLRGQYAVAPDGRFLINTIVNREGVMPITVLQNWRAQ